ncbi:glycosyltransferase [Paenibacillus sp.]|uniref:glycosyltransferase n=1 Tax=Paenibacillus sp. TaxID=58172 RepID=UPI0028126FA6|nr:glycosyltransferase [Paenibacillus sp.]
MKKKVLIASFDLEIGGVERSLISLLENFDYESYDVDLFLYRQQGEFLELLPRKVNLVKEIPQYTTIRKTIREVLQERRWLLGGSRIIAKVAAQALGKIKRAREPGHYQMQLMWKLALPLLPSLEERYDLAISFLWPHYFVAEKVKAKKKIAWIHTDYSNVDTNRTADVKMWNRFDHIVSVSEACKDSFVRTYRVLNNKVEVIENITSPEFVRKMAVEHPPSPMSEDDRFKIVTVARLSHAKGIDKAVEALKLLKGKGYDIAWYVVGYGGEEGAIRTLIERHRLERDFILLGKKTNPYPYIREADLYVQPSRYEGKAVTVLEAQILSKPVLITNYPTAPSQVKNGIDGHISELSAHGLAEGIERLYLDSNYRERLTQACKASDYGNSTRELQKLYRLIT